MELRAILPELLAIPIFIEANIKLPIQASILFIFMSFLRPPVHDNEMVGCTALEEMFNRWWMEGAVNKRWGQACLQDPQSCIEQQRRYNRQVTRSGVVDVQLKDIGKLWRLDIMKALLVNEVSPHKKGTAFARQLRPPVARLCLYKGELPAGLEDESQALFVARSCWTSLCQISKEYVVIIGIRALEDKISTLIEGGSFIQVSDLCDLLCLVSSPC